MEHYCDDCKMVVVEEAGDICTECQAYADQGEDWDDRDKHWDSDITEG